MANFDNFDEESHEEEFRFRNEADWEKNGRLVSQAMRAVNEVFRQEPHLRQAVIRKGRFEVLASAIKAVPNLWPKTIRTAERHLDVLTELGRLHDAQGILRLLKYSSLTPVDGTIFFNHFRYCAQHRMRPQPDLQQTEEPQPSTPKNTNSAGNSTYARSIGGASPLAIGDIRQRDNDVACNCAACLRPGPSSSRCEFRQPSLSDEDDADRSNDFVSNSEPTNEIIDSQSIGRCNSLVPDDAKRTLAVRSMNTEYAMVVRPKRSLCDWFPKPVMVPLSNEDVADMTNLQRQIVICDRLVTRKQPHYAKTHIDYHLRVPLIVRLPPDNTAMPATTVNESLESASVFIGRDDDGVVMTTISEDGHNSIDTSASLAEKTNSAYHQLPDATKLDLATRSQVSEREIEVVASILREAGQLPLVESEEAAPVVASHVKVQRSCVTRLRQSCCLIAAKPHAAIPVTRAEKAKFDNFIAAFEDLPAHLVERSIVESSKKSETFAVKKKPMYVVDEEPQSSASGRRRGRKGDSAPPTPSPVDDANLLAEFSMAHYKLLIATLLGTGLQMPAIIRFFELLQRNSSNDGHRQHQKK